jgi:hypothetical protein
MAFQKVEFEFPDERKEEDDLEIEGSGALEVDIGGKGKNTRGEDIKKPKVEEEDDIELEIVDDTPKADRGRTPSEPPEEVTDEELENYSEKVRNRIKHFTKGYHDERRAKEEALRERQELEALTQRLMEENKSLKSEGSKSQTALLKQAKLNAETAYANAKSAYKTAYNDGDGDKLLEAQEALSNAKARLDKVNSYTIPPLQAEKESVQRTQEPPKQQPVTRDERAEQWARENTWFNQDSEMTAYALGLHNKLVKGGMDPTSDEYYDKIDGRMRELFPDNFDAKEKPSQRKQSNVVAPASRSTTPKKIRLTQTQVRLAKRLGLTNEQYAKQVAIDMRNNNG